MSVRRGRGWGQEYGAVRAPSTLWAGCQLHGPRRQDGCCGVGDGVQIPRPRRGASLLSVKGYLGATVQTSRLGFRVRANPGGWGGRGSGPCQSWVPARSLSSTLLSQFPGWETEAGGLGSLLRVTQGHSRSGAEAGARIHPSVPSSVFTEYLPIGGQALPSRRVHGVSGRCPSPRGACCSVVVGGDTAAERVSHPDNCQK